MVGSSFRTWMRTSGVTDSEPSLMPWSIAAWECASISPGMRYLSVPSITRTPLGISTSLPTAVIVPSCTTTVPFSMTAPVMVMIVTLRIAMSCATVGAATAGAAAAARTPTAARAANPCLGEGLIVLLLSAYCGRCRRLRRRTRVGSRNAVPPRRRGECGCRRRTGHRP